MEILKKSELRGRIKEARRNLSAERAVQMNQMIFGKFLGVKQFSEADCIYCYMSFEQEAGTELILRYLWDHNQPVAVPRVSGKHMKFYYVTSYEDTEPGCMGILEPKASCILACNKSALVIVPGLAFDKEGYRLGYGGGYYDRFFKEEPMHKKIGIGYDFQMVDKVPRDEWDEKLDYILIADEAKGEIWYDAD